MSDRTHLGITGSRHGLYDPAEFSIEAILDDMPPDTAFHHGDCVGVDAEVAHMAMSRGMWIVCHPPEDPKLRAWVPANEFRDEAPYLDRNRAIVDECDYLIAAPRESVNPYNKGGGTWYTIRYARECERDGIIVYPDGRTELL